MHLLPVGIKYYMAAEFFFTKGTEKVQNTAFQG